MTAGHATCVLHSRWTRMHDHIKPSQSRAHLLPPTAPLEHPDSVPARSAYSRLPKSWRSEVDATCHFLRPPGSRLYRQTWQR